VNVEHVPATAKTMIDVGSAQALIRERAVAMPVEYIPLAQAEGRVLAETIDSPSDLPPFDNSAMDGYALRWNEDLRPGAALMVVAELAAGDVADTVAPGVVSIMTGARILDGRDTVVPVEDVAVLRCADDGSPLEIRIDRTTTRGQHVRRAGEDIACGDEAVQAGTRLGAAELMLLRGIGIAQVAVRQRPRVVVACTGRELVDVPGRPLLPGQIYNTNGPYLALRLREAGADVLETRTLPDDASVFVAMARQWLAGGVDIVISTGAVSMGRYDFVPDALRTLGGETVFHKVKMRPGKPLLFATLPGGALFFGLPGNPVSSAVGMRFFVETALRCMLAMPSEQSWRMALAGGIDKKPGFHLYQKAELRLDAGGQLSLGLLKGQESFKTRPLLPARVWAGLPAQAETLLAGALVDVHPLCHFDQTLFTRT